MKLIKLLTFSNAKLFDPLNCLFSVFYIYSILALTFSKEKLSEITYFRV